MVKYPPYPGKPVQAKKLIMTQHPFWDFMHTMEFPVLYVIQRLVFASPLRYFWYNFAKLASAKVLAFAPCILYGLGYPEQARRLSITLVCYALISSFGKAFVIRRRPGSFPEVFSLNCAATSSFPSRHTIGVTILASFTPFKWPYIVLMVVDRLACGQHYLSDCLVGLALGELSLYVASFFENPNLITVLMLVAIKIWGGGAKILGGCLPLIMAPKVVISKVLFPLAFIDVVVLRIMRKGEKVKEPMRLMVEELFATSLTVFIMTKSNRLLEVIKNQEMFQDTFVPFL